MSHSAPRATGQRASETPSPIKYTRAPAPTDQSSDEDDVVFVMNPPQPSPRKSYETLIRDLRVTQATLCVTNERLDNVEKAIRDLRNITVVLGGRLGLVEAKPDLADRFDEVVGWVVFHSRVVARTNSAPRPHRQMTASVAEERERVKKLEQLCLYKEAEQQDAPDEAAAGDD